PINFLIEFRILSELLIESVAGINIILLIVFPWTSIVSCTNYWALRKKVLVTVMYSVMGSLRRRNKKLWIEQRIEVVQNIVFCNRIHVVNKDLAVNIVAF